MWLFIFFVSIGCGCSLSVDGGHLGPESSLVIKASYLSPGVWEVSRVFFLCFVLASICVQLLFRLLKEIVIL